MPKSQIAFRKVSTT